MVHTFIQCFSLSRGGFIFSRHEEEQLSDRAPTRPLEAASDGIRGSRSRGCTTTIGTSFFSREGFIF
jgi:hypothetical protein